VPINAPEPRAVSRQCSHRPGRPCGRGRGRVPAGLPPGRLPGRSADPQTGQGRPNEASQRGSAAVIQAS